MINFAVVAITAAVAFTCSRARRCFATSDDKGGSATPNSAHPSLYPDSYLYLYDVHEALALSNKFVEAHESCRACPRSSVSTASTITNTNSSPNPNINTNTRTAVDVDAVARAPSSKVKDAKITTVEAAPTSRNTTRTQGPDLAVDEASDDDAKRVATSGGKRAAAVKSMTKAGSRTVSHAVTQRSKADGGPRLSDGVSHLLPAVKPLEVVHQLYMLAQGMKSTEKPLSAHTLTHLNALHFKATGAGNKRLAGLVEYVLQKNNILLEVLDQRKHGGPSNHPPPVSRL